MKKLILMLTVVFLFVSCTTTDPITIKQVEYRPYTLDITAPYNILLKAKPSTVPDFPDKPEEDTESQYLFYLAKTIHAYDISLQEWQDYSSKCEQLIQEIAETLSGTNTAKE